METKSEQTAEFTEYGLPQIQSDIGDLVYYSTSLSRQLREHGWPTDNVSAETFQNTAVDIYGKARLFGDSLLFSSLAIYIEALTDILEERLKE